MKNFEITACEGGKKYWISRAVAVCAIVIVTDENGQKYILINKRGAGTPDYQHCWNIPCGYLDWDETTSQACTREVLEECKVYIDHSLWTQFGDIEDSITSNRQNVTVRKYVNISMDHFNRAKEIGKKMIEAQGGEENEVEEIELMPLAIDNINSHRWAFNHKILITKIKNIF